MLIAFLDNNVWINVYKILYDIVLWFVYSKYQTIYIENWIVFRSRSDSIGIEFPVSKNYM